VESEPDCGGIEILRDVDDGTRFILYERWSSREAYTGPHMRTPHLLAFIAQAPKFIAGPPTINFLSPVK
jgi:quinol monooxygenase YgiN